jgi:hypothetical protein
MKKPNILKIDTLSGDWCDNDIIMLHACFQLLVDCIENEKLNDMTDWSQDEKFKSAKLEIDELYNWWKERSKKEDDGKLDPIWSEKQYAEDNKMLIRLIKIRSFLWT